VSPTIQVYKKHVTKHHRPCKQPKLKSRDEQQYSETERSSLPLEDPSTAEIKTPDDVLDASEFTWPGPHHPIGLPTGNTDARNLPAIEHDVDLSSIRDTPIEVEDDVTELRRCKRKCRYYLDGCKVSLSLLSSPLFPWECKVKY
jgi:hypothetical protein